MNCLECGGTYTEKSGIYSLTDPYVGEIIVQGVLYYQCDKCGDILYPEAMAQAIESKRNEHIHEILSGFPISDFISAADTASILGISRQALHKNSRINHGFIYQTKFGALTLYLEQSVQQYKKTRDGRFPLHLQRQSPSTEYVKSTVPIKISSPYERYQRSIKLVYPFYEEKRVGQKEYSYAS